jgi:OOP family OmpA-OmpF porin
MTPLTRSILTILTLLATSSSLASAEVRPYVGGSVGEASVDLDLTDVPDAGFRIEDEDFAFKAYFGLQLPGPFAFEVGYRDLGSISDDGGLFMTTSETDGIDASLLGKLPIGPVSLFARGGMIAWDTKVRLTDNGALPDLEISDDGTDPFWGVGISVEFDRVGIRAEFERFELDLPDDLTMLSVGMTFSF